MDRLARRGPLARKGGHFRNCLFVAVEGTLWRKNKISKKVSMPKNRKGDPLRFFNIHSVAKHQKIEGEKIFHFRKKSQNAGKQEKRFWFNSLGQMVQ